MSQRDRYGGDEGGHFWWMGRKAVEGGLGGYVKVELCLGSGEEVRFCIATNRSFVNWSDEGVADR